MIFFILLILVTSVYSHKLLEIFPIEHSVETNVTKDIALKSFINQNIPFDIISIGPLSVWMEDLITEVRKQMPMEPFKIIHMKKLGNRILKITRSAIILGEQKYLEYFHNYARLFVDYPKELKFLMYTKNIDAFNSTDYLINDRIKTNRIELYEYFLHDNGDKIDFVTFEWFTAEACNKRQKRLINTFDKLTQKWKIPFNKKEKKFRNFYGCEIVVMQVGTPSLGAFKDRFKRVRGHALDILDVVGSASNFSVYRQLGSVTREAYYLNEHNNARLKPQIIIEIKPIRSASYHSTGVFENIKVMIVLTSSEFYNAYEKLLLPFDFSTWMLLALTFSIAFITIFIVNHMSKEIQKIFYGDSSGFLAFNVLGTFFGIAQARVPSTNFPRMILMNFILFCLVIRTAYQGVFFELMATDMRKPVPKNLNELLEKNYLIYGIENSLEVLVLKDLLTKESQALLKTISSNKDSVCSAFHRDAKKKAMMMTDLSIPLFSKVCSNDPIVLKDSFITLSVAMIVCQNHFLFHVIDDVVEKTIPAGILQHWYDFAKWEKIVRLLKANNREGRRSLSLSEWNFGFVLWSIFCGISTIVFILEMLQWPRIKRKWKIKYDSKDNKIKKKSQVQKMHPKVVHVKSHSNAIILIQNEKSLKLDSKYKKMVKF
ncbi:hypothetical protein PVAND_002301 [Polypedilum vanderplanki]|uniref:Ionotropic receptor n=1 Tax=Polypedilum vanderplanki TaxID=319348 RepID=A0A9J6BQK1_POLVA|nr:hypothetical protein PVAND_002301 [Polypedilum vanderplanki]